MAHVQEVARALERHPDRVVLLGGQPTSPEGEYGWIEPGPPIDGDDGVVSAVRQFWEKPSEARAQMCLSTGCLWNTAIVVARARALLELGARALPEMSSRLAGLQRFVDSDREVAAVQQAYAIMAKASFSRAVLEVIGGEDRDRRGWIPPGDPLRGVQDGGRGAPVFRLEQDIGRLRGARELLGDVRGVLAHRDHHGAVRRDAECHPVQRLPQQAPRSEQLHVLLRPLLTDHLADEGSEPNPLTAGEHDSPQPSGVRHRATR
jgi:hypothetical protein